MIRHLLEGLFPRERQNLPQRDGERPNVALARVPSLRGETKRIRGKLF